MMNWLTAPPTYGIILLVSLLGLTICDWRWGLVAFGNKFSVRWRATLATIAVMVAVFLVWDLLGIALHVFSTNPNHVIGINLGTPNLPIEEVGFLILLNYSCLIVMAVVTRWGPRLLKKLGN